MSDALDRVRALLAAEVAGTLIGAALVEHCTRLALELGRASADAASVPHEVWHYLHDADVRLKDPAYAKVQLEKVRRVLGL
jgi:hypothetical protein